MTIEELEYKHCYIADNTSFGDYINSVTKLSIEFAISVLEDLEFRHRLMSDASSFTHGYRFLNEKIQELKQYLDEKI